MKNLLKTLRTFIGLLAEKKLNYFIFLLTVTFSAITSGIVPYFYKEFVDILPSGDYDKILKIIYLFIGIRVLNLLLNSASYYLGDKVSIPAASSLRVRVFKHLQDLDFAFHTSNSTGSLISRMKRGDGAFWGLNHSIHHRILKVVVGFGVMLYFFGVLDYRFTLIVAISFVISLFLMKYLIDYNMRTRKAFNKQEDEITRVVVDNIINFDTVKLFGMENREQRRLKYSFVEWEKTLWQHVMSFRVLDISIGGLLNLSIFVILLVGLNMFTSENISLGEFVLVLGFVNNFFPRLFDLFFGFRDIAKNYEDIRRYFDILDNEIEIMDPVKPIKLDHVKGEIEFKNVSFSYKDGKKNAVKNLSLTIREGQSVALVGRSGSGKTTLIKLLMRFYDVEKGEILIDSLNINKMTKSHLRSSMGVVPQEPIMFNSTVSYNIGYGKGNATAKEIEAAAKLANLHDFLVSLPNKYNTVVGERGVKLSGGQKQRLAIARMILSNPDIVIFDEATSQLDAENEKLISDAFWKATKNKTTIIIAHRLSTAKQADKIVVLEEGKVVEKGSHKEFLTKKKSLYKYFWDLQVNST